jgi:hypothetical protein
LPALITRNVWDLSSSRFVDRTNQYSMLCVHYLNVLVSKEQRIKLSSKFTKTKTNRIELGKLIVNDIFMEWRAYLTALQLMYGITKMSTYTL